jgi:CRISPR-associated exonuclease Cas4
MDKLLAIALVLVLLGILLVAHAKRGRKKYGLGSGQTVALDNLTIYSERLQLVGRPDRIERIGELLIPEEWKPSAKRVYPGHRLQLGAYFLLIEDEYGVRPSHGFVVLREGVRVQVENTEQLRSEVLAIASRIREQRAKLAKEISVNEPGWKCRACGQKSHCKQVSA